MKEADIETILGKAKAIAVVGFSSKAERAGYYVPEYLQQQGYRILPVNPNLTEGLGGPAYADLIDIPYMVDTVLIFQRSENVPPFVDAAIEIGAKYVWMQEGISNAVAAEKARAAGLVVVEDACMMVEHRAWKG